MTLRILIAGTALTLFSCTAPSTAGGPAPAPEPTAALERGAPAESSVAGERQLLDIPARNQAPERPDEGWCAETAIQESMLHFGAYAPQRAINRAGKPRHPDLYWDDVPVALRELGIDYSRWDGDGGQEAFTAWVRDELAAGHPVITGVKIYPTDHPRWGLDHIVLIVGIDEHGGMAINTTWGYRKRRSRAQLESKRNGISLANRYDRQFAYALTGFEDATGERVGLKLVREGGAEIDAVVRVTGLVQGRRYELRRFDDDGQVVDSRQFEASATSGKLRVTLDPESPSRFEVIDAEPVATTSRSRPRR